MFGIQDELLKGALTTVVNAGCNVNSVQVELLKGAMAGDAYSNGLAATAEHIIATISNANWIDRERMRQFFLEKVGFGSDMSLRSGSLCVERGILSPQRLAMHFQTQTDSSSWLRLTKEEVLLLKIALSSIIEQQRRHLSEKDDEGDGSDAVWADVDSTSEQSSDHESCAREDAKICCVSWASGEGALTSAPALVCGRSDNAVDNSPVLEVTYSSAPPSTPQEDVQTDVNPMPHLSLSALSSEPLWALRSQPDELSVATLQCANDSQASFMSSTLGIDPSAKVDSESTTNGSFTYRPDQVEQRAVSLRLILPSELEVLSPLNSSGGSRAALNGFSPSEASSSFSTIHKLSGIAGAVGGCDALSESINAQPFPSPAVSMLSSYASCSQALEPSGGGNSREMSIPEPSRTGPPDTHEQSVSPLDAADRGMSCSGSYSSYSSYGSCAMLGYQHSIITTAAIHCSPLDLDAQADADWFSSPDPSPPATPDTPVTARTPRTPRIISRTPGTGTGAGAGAGAAAEGAVASPLTVSATSWVTDTGKKDKGREAGGDDGDIGEDGECPGAMTMVVVPVRATTKY